MDAFTNEFLDPNKSSILIDARNGKGPESKTREMFPIPGLDGFVLGSGKRTSKVNKTITIEDAILLLVGQGYRRWKRVGRFMMHPYIETFPHGDNLHPFSVGDLNFTRMDDSPGLVTNRKALLRNCGDGEDRTKYFSLTFGAGIERYEALCDMFGIEELTKMNQTQDFIRKAILMGLNHAHSDIAGEKGSVLLEEMSVNDVRNAMSDYDFVMRVYKELKSIGEFRKSR